MDEDTEQYVTLRPMRHDRFSVLIPLLNFVANTIEYAGDTMRTYTIMLAQHSAQKEFDRRFERMLK